MNTNAISLTILAALALAIGCQQETSENHRAEQDRSVRIYTEAELNKLIISGSSVAEVTNRFGPPYPVIEIDQNTVLLVYSFPHEPRKETLHLSGFSIHIKDGKVAKWSPIMGESRQAGGSQGTFGDQSFQIFLAIDSLTNAANTVDSQGRADAGGFTASPEMAFQAKVFAGKDGNERPGERTVILVVNNQDASKLRNFTGANLGKRMLIVCRNRVIAAPAISATLTSRQLEFTVKDAGVLDILSTQ